MSRMRHFNQEQTNDTTGMKMVLLSDIVFIQKQNRLIFFFFFECVLFLKKKVSFQKLDC